MRFLQHLHTSSLAFVLAFCSITGSVSAQLVNEELCKAFNASTELYVFDYPSNTVELTTSSGRVISFVQLVQEAWADKVVKVISVEEYDKLPDVKNLFHITNSSKSTTYTQTKDRTYQSTRVSEVTKVRNYNWEFIIVQKGKSKLENARALNIVYLDWRSINEGLLPERLEFAVNTMKEQILLPQQGQRDKFSYMVDGLKPLLRSDTLYIWEDDLIAAHQKVGAIKDVYPHPYKIVPYQQIEQAITRKAEGVLYLEELDFGDNSCIQIRDASTGRLLYSASPVLGPAGSRVKAGMKARLTKL